MMTVDQIMQQLGGFTKVANAIKAPVTTVHSWKRANFIPEWRHAALLALAKKNRVPLSAADFPPPPPRKDKAA